MDQQVATVLLSFVLGALVGFALQPWHLRSLRYSIKQVIPMKCPVCKTRCQYKNTRWVQHRVLGWIDICEKCYQDLYNPFGKGKKE